MGNEYNAEIICILATRNQTDEYLTSKQDSISKPYNNVHYIHSTSEIQQFFHLNPKLPHRHNFTYLLKPDGYVILQGSNPKKDMENFKKFATAIANYNINH